MTSVVIDKVDGLSAATAIKGPCHVASTASLTLAGEQTIDGILTAESRVLVKNQTVPSENGIYVTSTGDWRRAADFSRNDDVQEGAVVIVTDGATSAGVWQLTTADPIVIGTSSIAFSDTLFGRLPAGGTLGQVPYKTSGLPYATAWRDLFDADGNLKIQNPLGDLTTLPMQPQITLGSDPTTGLWFGADASTNPVVAMVVRGVPAFYWFRSRNGSDTDLHDYRFGSPIGALENLSSPVFLIVGDVSRPKLATRGFILSELGDVIDIANRFANGDSPFDGPARPYTEEVAGAEIVSFYTQPMRGSIYTAGSAGYDYGSEYKSGLPILLTGAGPAFTNLYTVALQASAKTAYFNGWIRSFKLPPGVLSGANPTININGFGAKKLLRNNGAAPAANYWTAGAEFIATYSAAADGGTGAWLAENVYGSDNGGAGLTTDLKPVYYFGRSTGMVPREMDNPSSSSTAGMWEVRTTRRGQIREVPKLWVSSLGFVVAAGHSTFEDGQDAQGVYLDEAGAGVLPHPTPYRNRRGFFGGPVDPTVVEGSAPISIMASDAGRVMAQSIRSALARDKGMDIGHLRATDEIGIYGVKPGGVTINITALEDSGFGTARFTCATPHGLKAVDTVRLAGTQAGIGAYAADPADPDGTGFYDGVWTAIPVSTTKFDICAIFKGFNAQGTVAVASSTKWGSFFPSTGAFSFANSLRAAPGAAYVNYIEAEGSNTAGGVATVRATGGDTNIDLALSGKGTGVPKFGTFSANADAAITGYITIKDSAGNTRKLATIA